ncbi:unnamed protein product [Eretmochelys imbricata]
MYFFLMSLSILDLGSISVTIPKSMANSLMNTRSISYSGCVTKSFSSSSLLKPTLSYSPSWHTIDTSPSANHCTMRL